MRLKEYLVPIVVYDYQKLKKILDTINSQLGFKADNLVLRRPTGAILEEDKNQKIKVLLGQLTYTSDNEQAYEILKEIQYEHKSVYKFLYNLQEFDNVAKKYNPKHSTIIEIREFIKDSFVSSRYVTGLAIPCTKCSKIHIHDRFLDFKNGVSQCPNCLSILHFDIKYKNLNVPEIKVHYTEEP